MPIPRLLILLFPPSLSTTTATIVIIPILQIAVSILLPVATRIQLLTTAVVQVRVVAITVAVQSRPGARVAVVDVGRGGGVHAVQEGLGVALDEAEGFLLCDAVDLRDGVASPSRADAVAGVLTVVLVRVCVVGAVTAAWGLVGGGLLAAEHVLEGELAAGEMGWGGWWLVGDA
jgi:hypothetical protein